MRKKVWGRGAVPAGLYRHRYRERGLSYPSAVAEGKEKLTLHEEVAILIRFREYPERAKGNKSAGAEKSPGKSNDFPVSYKDGKRRFALYWILEKENRMATWYFRKRIVCGPSITCLRHPPPWMGYAGRNSETELGRPEGESLIRVGRPGHRRLFSSGCKGFYRREAGFLRQGMQRASLPLRVYRKGVRKALKRA